MTAAGTASAGEAEPSRHFDPARLNDQEQARLHKLALLREQGLDPYPARVERTHTIADARALEPGTDEEAPQVAVAGRIVLLRDLGRMSFAQLDAGTGAIQIMVRRNRVGADWYGGVWKACVDLGDFLSVRGSLILTRTGELTVDAQVCTVAGKALKPLPDKWHGLQDPEARYRRRYVDLLANPEAREVFRLRARTIRSIRNFLDDLGYLEVETPVLQPIYGGAAARPFTTHHNQLHQDLYLRISFELYLKRLIVGGLDRVYEIGRDFRNEGVSFKHNPEFTQLEFYEAWSDYRGIMERLESMLARVAVDVCGSTEVAYQGRTVSFAPPFERMTLRDAILEHTGLDIHELVAEADLRDAMRARGMDAGDDLNWGKLVDSLLSRYVEPRVVNPVFLYEYPKAISPFAKGVPGAPRLVERFELFAAGMEVANAFSEINDPMDQYQRFLGEKFLREHGDDEAHQVDDDFVEALTWGMPPTGGCGVGIDRLTMLLADRPNIREVILFPHLRDADQG